MRASRLALSIAALSAVLLLPAHAQPGAPNLCPQPEARWVQCANGVRISAYEPAPELTQWCEALADPDVNLKRVRASSPLYQLDGTYRTMWTGLSGWLVMPRNKGITDFPRGVADFFSEFGCSPPR